MNVTACIATRGDVDMQPILDSLPDGWEKVVWDNSRVPDLGPYGRFAAIEDASNSLVYVQDDDVIVSDPQAIVDAWERDDHVVCNMPQEFRPHYHDSAMVGFGGCFHRDLPARTFARYLRYTETSVDDPLFLRESCRILTCIAPRVLVDVPVTSLPYANDSTRLWKQPGHVQSRDKALELARRVRDAG